MAVRLRIVRASIVIVSSGEVEDRRLSRWVRPGVAVSRAIVSRRSSIELLREIVHNRRTLLVLSFAHQPPGRDVAVNDNGSVRHAIPLHKPEQGGGVSSRKAHAAMGDRGHAERRVGKPMNGISPCEKIESASGHRHRFKVMQDAHP